MTYQGSLIVVSNFFADDAKIYLKVNTQVQANHLQGNVNNSESWADI